MIAVSEPSQFSSVGVSQHGVSHGKALEPEEMKNSFDKNVKIQACV